MTDKAFKIASQHIQQHGFDTIECAREKDGQKYFHFWRSGSEGLKLGNPLIIKVSESGRITLVRRLDEIMWALGEAKKIKATEQQP